MPSRNWKVRVEDILQAASKIEQYVAGMTFETFRADDKTIDAVVRNLEIIGEASRNVPPPVRDRHLSVPWDKMIGIRNVLIHEYSGVSVPIVWRTIREDLPPLVPLLREILEGEDDDVVGI